MSHAFISYSHTDPDMKQLVHCITLAIALILVVSAVPAMQSMQDKDKKRYSQPRLLGTSLWSNS